MEPQSGLESNFSERRHAAAWFGSVSPGRSVPLPRYSLGSRSGKEEDFTLAPGESGGRTSPSERRSAEEEEGGEVGLLPLESTVRGDVTAFGNGATAIPRTVCGENERGHGKFLQTGPEEATRPADHRGKQNHLSAPRFVLSPLAVLAASPHHKL